MQPVTTNYGLAGGSLDATHHIAAAMTRLLNQQEILSAQEQMTQIAQTSRQRDSSKYN
jgi:hypothetical protein